jgi:Rieske Fe-S protein
MTDSQVETEGSTTTRRAMLAGVGAVGASALLAACGTDEKDGSLADSGGDAATTPAATTPGATAAPTTGASDAGGGANSGTKLAATSAIPADGGKVFADKKVVVTQPASGEFKCFSAVCTHQGCTVANVKNGTINCGCHGSQFSMKDGSVKKGPATKPLDEVTIKVQGGSVWLNA